MSQVLDAVLGWSGWPVYLVVGSLVFAEAALFVGLVLPGETALLIGAVLTERGTISLPLLLVVAAVCAVAGDSVGYAVGRAGGPAIRNSRLGEWVGPARWRRAEDLVARHGAWAVFAGRWVGVARALVPTTAGVVAMPYRRFLLGNVAGALSWIAAVVAVGYAAGGSLAVAGSWLGRTSLAAAVAVLVIVVAVILSSRRRRAAHPPARCGRDAGPAKSVRPRVFLAATTAALFGLGAVELADAVRQRDALAAYDPSVTAAVVADRTPVLTTIGDAASFVGSTTVLVVLSIALIAWLLWRRHTRAAVIVTGSMVASAALTVGLKNVIGRLRPPASTMLGPIDYAYSFPSGHTLNSTVFFGLVAGLVFVRLRSGWGRAVVVLAWLAASATVGASRVYLGYHWLTDVLGGFSIAVVVLCLAVMCHLLILARRHRAGGGGGLSACAAGGPRRPEGVDGARSGADRRWASIRQPQPRESTLAAMRSPIGMELVAAGDGALHTWVIRSVS